MKRIKGRIAETIYPNGQGAITAEAHQALLLEMVDEINSKKQDTIEGGAPFSEQGNYPDLSAGFAENLVGRGESVPAEFTFRASGGKSIKDGAARIKRIKGNSVVWNQKIKGFASWNLQGGTIEGNEAIWSASNRTGALNAYSNIFAQHTTHKYLITADVKASSSNVGLGVYFTNSPLVKHTGSGNYESLAIITNGKGDGIDACYLTDTSTSGYGEIRAKNYRCIDLTHMFQAGNEPTTIEEYEARKPIVADEYAYNEGEVIHMNTESIKSVGDNAWDEQWEKGYIDSSSGVESSSDSFIRSKNFCRIIGGEDYYIIGNGYVIVLYDENYQWLDFWGAIGEPRKVSIDSRARYFKVAFKSDYGTTYKNDVLISLYHSGWKAEKDDQYQPYWQDTLPLPIIRKYFPDGMKSAGSAHDEIRFNKASGKWEKVVRIAEVDMGSLTWGKEWYNEAEAYRIFTDITNKAAGLSNILCGAYTNANVGDGIMADFTITGNTSTNYVYLKDSSYSAEGVDALIDSLQGVMLYYELAEPVIREIDEPIGTDYKVADFGTEQAISSIPSAPFSADIIYQFNAVDMIRELWLKVQELESRLNNGGL